MIETICKTPQNLILRSDILRKVRTFFYDRNFIEVETPVRIPAPANEAFLEAPEAGDEWLRTSPELHMKRLLAHGLPRIFQIGPCFRANECGSRHNPEFTMIEWYRANEKIDALYNDVQELVENLMNKKLEFQKRTVQSLYLEFAGWNPLDDWNQDRFDYDMATKIEPNLPENGFTYIIDYPAQAAALAKLNPNDSRVAERFEAYIGKMEIANGYGELTNAEIQRTRFLEAQIQRKNAGLPVYPLDEAFLNDLPKMPETAGIALGIDRLVMAVTGAEKINDIRAFCQNEQE